MTFDINSIRKDFPILGRDIRKKPLIYFDNAASAQKPRDVIDSIMCTYSHEYANIHRGLHYMANAVTDKYEKARDKVRRFINASSVKEIIFTRSATESINLVSYGWGARHISTGDEIVLSVMEHHSNIIPWYFLRQRRGASLVWVPIDNQGFFHIDEFKNRLTERTKLIAITHMSNVLGTVIPIKEICRIAHERNIPVLVDGSQGSVHNFVDVQDIDCDWYIITGHKLYGPSGIGGLYSKESRLNEMDPFMGGSEMIADVTQDMVTYADLPYRFEPGTPPISQAIALGVALDYVEKIDRKSIFSYERELARYVRSRLKEVRGMQLVNESLEDSPIISFRLGNIHPYDLALFLDGEGIAIRAGTHCANPLLKFLGIDSLCRASLAMYNTYEEADKFIETLKKSIQFFQ
ncbi:cysteine desulfurase [Candidatus Liberibacter asiaticus]|uniref:cysteine desulfurase n=1 Tax=Candidatus Liberibacter asiaticus str. gxpsy TaxID=1174529 RepID=A0ABM5NGJ4_LIBAS|nr:cysteine desulfurase [Candidatus Liberibacter asiaticus]AGH17298.1 putative aminotransferase involved in iron-sulfur cluster biogenesis [Candidatus Liberibacter asiaticus str. gxpsy]ALK07586.1 SufS family cysteine desulfurase [Candidatus Liberibacter asiaticus]ASK53077.1 cysteine desulfurase [Candidatus Liberibacter asiaticus]AWL14402.1 cysteine desulfurase [Candidatus Liberibacter asiaticus]KAE9509765.1 putative cysteine desulfurase [Candidatus Liberibacter asiaticus]